MQGVICYLDGGKGHYIPAKAIQESMLKAGHEVEIAELFLALDARFWYWITKSVWRFLLHHPKLEKVISGKHDNQEAWFKWVNLARYVYKPTFERWFKKTNPEFIVVTHFLCGILLTPMVKACGRDIPVFYYSPDVFMSVKGGISNSFEKLYIASEEGLQQVVEQGMDPSRAALCSFPLQHKFLHIKNMDKATARTKLGLRDTFTVLLTLGGEGIGSTEFVEHAAKQKLDIQVLLVGKISTSTTLKYDLFRTRFPEFDIHMIGFVENIHEYFIAADIVIGKQGANTLMEAIFMRRPCMISELLYTSEMSARYLQKYQIGWSEDDPAKQVAIVKNCAENTDFHAQMEKNFDAVPLKFGADEFADQIIQDVLIYKERKSSSSGSSL